MAVKNQSFLFLGLEIHSISGKKLDFQISVYLHIMEPRDLTMLEYRKISKH